MNEKLFIYAIYNKKCKGGEIMKKIITLIILLLFFAFILSGCIRTSYESDTKKTNDNSDGTKDTNDTDDSEDHSEVCYWN